MRLTVCIGAHDQTRLHGSNQTGQETCHKTQLMSCPHGRLRTGSFLSTCEFTHTALIRRKFSLLFRAFSHAGRAIHAFTPFLCWHSCIYNRLVTSSCGNCACAVRDCAKLKSKRMKRLNRRPTETAWTCLNFGRHCYRHRVGPEDRNHVF